MRGLAFRRHQFQRAKRRAIRYLRWLWADEPQWITERAVRQHAADRAPCSCHLCGNPRRFFGQVTRQEKRAADG